MSKRPKPRRSSPLNIPSALELFLDSINIVRKNIWVFGTLYIIPFIFAFHAWVWTPSIGSRNGQHWENSYSWAGSGFSTTGAPVFLWFCFVGFSIIWFLFVLITGTIIQAMCQQAQLEASEKKPLDLIKLWKVAKENAWRMFKLYVVMTIYIGIGLILFIIPGIIMIRRYFFAPYIMLETKGSVKEVMEQSEAITSKHSSAIYDIMGVMAVIGIINAFPFIGWMISFIAGMFYSVAPALRYTQLKKY